MPDARLLAGAAALVGASAAGLGVPAPSPRIEESTDKAVFDPPDPTWPDGLLRWLDVAHRGLVPRAETAAIAGSGRIRLGRSPWLPVSYRTSHVLGQEFAAELAATWYGRPVLRAHDGYADHIGVTSVRGQTTFGPGLDQGARPFLWSEAILIPATWGLDGVHMTQPSETTIDVSVEPGTGLAAPLTARIDLDPDSGLPTRFEVPWRAKDPQGEEGVAWWVDYETWEPNDHGMHVRQAAVNWADDSRPWLRLRLEPPALNVDVTEAMGEIRALLRQSD
ncbi:MAG: hypothetical protein K0U64_05045 [Actinomycetia bacterium]|nr:hypothetical protein [Actinomycetes bacterium]